MRLMSVGWIGEGEVIKAFEIFAIPNKKQFTNVSMGGFICIVKLR